MIPNIDTLSTALYVPKALHRARAPVVRSSSADDSVRHLSIERSKSLIAKAQGSVSKILGFISDLSHLINQATQTSLPSSFPTSSRVSIQGQISVLLKAIDTVAAKASLGTENLLQPGKRSFKITTSSLGGSITASSFSMEIKALGLKDINILSDLGIKDAVNRIQIAGTDANLKSMKLNTLESALTSSDISGALATFNNNVLNSTPTAAQSFYSPFGPTSQSQTFQRGSLINITG